MKEFVMTNKVLTDKQLKVTEKVYYSMYLAFGEREADLQFLSLVTKQTMYNIKEKLIKKKYIERHEKKIEPTEIKQLVLGNKNTGGVCEWCGCKTSALQKHHYPISQRDGGDKVVNICPNCHYEYHLFERS